MDNGLTGSIRPRKTHELKTWPEFFEQTRSGRKKFELRRNDRDFRVEDELLLKEFDPVVLEDNLPQAHRTEEDMALAYEKAYTGRELLVRVDYLMKAEDITFDSFLGSPVQACYVIMSISLCPMEHGA